VPWPFLIEFRCDVVAVACKGQAPLSQIVRDFGISESCLHRWLKLADIEEGTGVTGSEPAELRDLRRLLCAPAASCPWPRRRAVTR